MIIISLIEASKDFGIKNLFKDLTLHISEGDRLGLIGPNGAGKSTLLKVIAGLEPLGNGKRHCSPQRSVILVGQESSYKSNRTVLEEVLAGCGEKRELLLRFTKISQEIAQFPDNKHLLSELGQLSERMDIAQAWGLEQQCQEVLQRLGINELQRPIEELSGGYRKRVALASALVAQPDVLLLDEPTNHLDATAVEWLQNWLDKYRGALILVTHDRYVLDQVTTKMIEVANGKVRNYKGNYSTYLEQKTAEEKSEKSSLSKFKGILRRELTWLKQGPKARSTKQKARLQRIEEMKTTPKISPKKSLELQTNSRRLGKLVIEAKDLQATTNGKKNGKILIDNFSYSFSPEDRVGIIGPNGSGKSSLLDLIAGRKVPTNGTLELGQTVHIGYLDQHTNDFKKSRDLNHKVIDFVKESASQVTLGKEQITASQLLERFLFPLAQQHSPLCKLSGGERRRLTLCKMLITSPNVLLLDEPTNDLDVQTLSVLEDFLEDFKGCVVLVSHDRYFLDRTVDRIFSFEGGFLKQFEGNYSNFLDRKQIQSKQTLSKPKYQELPKVFNSPKEEKNFLLNPKKVAGNDPIKNKLRRRSFKETKELEELDKSIPLLEAKKLSIETALATENKDLTNLSQKLADAQEKLERAEDRWLELSELSP